MLPLTSSGAAPFEGAYDLVVDVGDGAAGGLTWVEVAGDAEWLGGVGLPVRVQPGEPALLSVGAGERELR
jgi:hypothetical protein